MRTIALNQSHCLDTTQNNTYVYNFPNSVQFVNDESIAVASISMFYSWYNISAALSNNTYTYTWTSGATTTTYTVLIPDGIYNISDLNKHLQFTMVNNGS